jgi:hypothetical protein
MSDLSEGLAHCDTDHYLALAEVRERLAVSKQAAQKTDNKLESNSKNKNIRDLYRGINEFKKGYQPITNLEKDERGNLLADPHKILNRWKNYFCQLLNVHRVGSVRQTKTYIAEPFVPETSGSEDEVATGKLKRYKSPGVDQIPPELIQAGEKTLHLEIRKLNKLMWNKEGPPPSGKSQLWY